MTFVKRELQFDLAYGTGVIGEDAPERVRLNGHRASVTVETAGGAGLGLMTARIYGMTASLMNRVTTIGGVPTVHRRNTIAVSAGDAGGVLSQIFEGTITQAYADFSQAPEVAMVITAAAGMIERLLPIAPSSYAGPVDAVLVMADLAAKAGLRFENGGVNAVFSKVYLKGSLGEQIDSCAAAGMFERLIDKGTLAIWPRNGHRGGATPLLSVDTGMVGYPSFTSTGLIVNSIFLPTVDVGRLVQVKSSLANLGDTLLSAEDQVKNEEARKRNPGNTSTKKEDKWIPVFPVSGTWVALVVRHNLSAETPGGPWFTEMQLKAPEQVVLPR